MQQTNSCNYEFKWEQLIFGAQDFFLLSNQCDVYNYLACHFLKLFSPL